MKKLPIAEIIRKLFGGDGSFFSITFGVGVGCTRTPYVMFLAISMTLADTVNILVRMMSVDVRMMWCRLINHRLALSLSRSLALSARLHNGVRILFDGDRFQSTLGKNGPRPRIIDDSIFHFSRDVTLRHTS